MSASGEYMMSTLCLRRFVIHLTVRFAIGFDA